MTEILDAPPTSGIPNLEVLDRTLRDLAAGDPDIRVLTADSRISGKLAPFAAESERVTPVPSDLVFQPAALLPAIAFP